jgi:hypothetical protein
MIEHNIKPDRSYYLQRQIAKPLKRILCGTNLIKPEFIDVPLKQALKLIYKQDLNLKDMKDFFTTSTTG